MRLLTWLIGLPFAAVAIAFAVANRTPVTVDPWPLPFQLEAPLSLLVLGGGLLGLLVGAFLAWSAGGKTRRLARQQAKRLKDLEAIKS